MSDGITLGRAVKKNENFNNLLDTTFDTADTILRNSQPHATTS